MCHAKHSAACWLPVPGSLQKPDLSCLGLNCRQEGAGWKGGACGTCTVATRVFLQIDCRMCG